MLTNSQFCRKKCGMGNTARHLVEIESETAFMKKLRGQNAVKRSQILGGINSNLVKYTLILLFNPTVAAF